MPIRIACLLSLLLCAARLTAAAKSHHCMARHLPDTAARTYPTDSIRAHLSRFTGDTANQYRVRPDHWRSTIRTLRKFSELLVFNENGSAILLHDSAHCVNISPMLEHALPTNVDKSRYLEMFIPMLEPISPVTWQRNQFTAMIFWNRAMGIFPHDCPFEWARQLRFMYGGNILIIWVNTDLNDGPDEASGRRNLEIMQNLLSNTQQDDY